MGYIYLGSEVSVHLIDNSILNFSAGKFKISHYSKRLMLAESVALELFESARLIRVKSTVTTSFTVFVCLVRMSWTVFMVFLV